MTKEEAIRKLKKHKAEYLDEWVDYSGVTEALDMAIKALTERPKGECASCKRSSDYCCKTDGDKTRCPIEEHYVLPRDGYCHLYEPYKGGDNE